MNNEPIAFATGNCGSAIVDVLYVFLSANRLKLVADKMISLQIHHVCYITQQQYLELLVRRL